MGAILVLSLLSVEMILTDTNGQDHWSRIDSHWQVKSNKLANVMPTGRLVTRPAGSGRRNYIKQEEIWLEVFEFGAFLSRLPPNYRTLEWTISTRYTWVYSRFICSIIAWFALKFSKSLIKMLKLQNLDFEHVQSLGCSAWWSRELRCCQKIQKWNF